MIKNTGLMRPHLSVLLTGTRTVDLLNRKGLRVKMKEIDLSTHGRSGDRQRFCAVATVRGNRLSASCSSGLEDAGGTPISVAHAP